MHLDASQLAQRHCQAVLAWVAAKLGVLARRLVGEHLADFDAFKLPFRVLVGAADPDVTNALTEQGSPQTEIVIFRRRLHQSARFEAGCAYGS